MRFAETLLLFILVVFSGFLLGAQGAADAPLDPLYKGIEPIQEYKAPLSSSLREEARLPQSSDLRAVFDVQTPVKSQGKRGTCAIFSATGMVESLLLRNFGEALDLNENYLEFVVQTRIKPVSIYGSDIPENIPAFNQHGGLLEETWPYESYDWAKPEELPAEEKRRADATCRSLFGSTLLGCLLTHRNPFERTGWEQEAQAFGELYSFKRLTYLRLNDEYQIKTRLAQNEPLILSLEFFYGAWNHRKMETYAIGTRNQELWEKGVVGEPSGRDIEISRYYPAGHSIILVGYDDKRAVYYFKNSWGIESFGLRSDLFGPQTSPGYGSLPYSYAHRYGKFFQVEMN